MSYRYRSFGLLTKDVNAFVIGVIFCACQGTTACGLLENPEETESTEDTARFEDCDAFMIEYDLAGSQFEIRNTPLGAGDATNDIGPGRLRVRYPAVSGAKANGPVALIEYTNVMQFTVNQVETDMIASAGPDTCGISTGDFNNGIIEWSGPILNYQSKGEVTCHAGELVCGLANLPNGEPVDRDTETDQDLNPFVFLEDGSFTMEWVEIPNDDAGDTFLSLKGREVVRICIQNEDCQDRAN